MTATRGRPARRPARAAAVVGPHFDGEFAPEHSCQKLGNRHEAEMLRRRLANVEHSSARFVPPRAQPHSGRSSTHSGCTSALARPACDGTEDAEPGHVDLDDDGGARARALARDTRSGVVARRGAGGGRARRVGATSQRERGRPRRARRRRRRCRPAPRPTSAPPSRAAPSDSANPSTRTATMTIVTPPLARHAIRARSPLDPHGRRRVQVGIREQHADQRQVGDRVVLHRDADLAAQLRAARRRRRSHPGSLRCAARAAAPGSGSTLAARAASRAACTTPIWSRTTSPTWMTASTASTTSGSTNANSTVAWPRSPPGAWRGFPRAAGGGTTRRRFTTGAPCR